MVEPGYRRRFYRAWVEIGVVGEEMIRVKDGSL